ncbi:MAG: phenylalanine--tRNA ligase subunit alpha, partial [Lachnospiraceae bacterium]|nr:phenylalanine--tRNA ligase subunit alpha [Lachnospiraceae bacterium]
MKDKLKKIMDTAIEQIDATEQLDKLNDIKVVFLGKKGELTSLLKSMKDLAPEDRPKAGQMVNEARTKIEGMLEAKKKEFEKAVLEEKLANEKIDVTLPGTKLPEGHRHPGN